MVKKETVETRPNEKIENLNLIALRKYACAKINSQKDWYLKCVECPGLDSCRAGKRAVEIIENDTKPVKAKDPVIPKPSASDLKYMEALKQKDPVGYLREVCGYDSRWRAAFVLRQWMRKRGYSDERIREFYDGNPDFHRFGIKGGEQKAKKTDSLLRQVLEMSKTPEDILINWKKKTGNQLAYSSAYRWIKKYPELDKKYNFRQVARLCQHIHRIDDDVQPDDEEEVSVKDFLSEMENEPATDTVEIEIPVDDFLKDHEIHDPDGNVMSPSEAKAVLEKKQQELNEKLLHQEGNMTRSEALDVVFGDKSEDGLPEPSDTQGMLLQVFGRKKQELRRRFAMIDAQVQTLIAEKKTVQEKMDLLDKTAELFGMRPTNVRDAQL